VAQHEVAVLAGESPDALSAGETAWTAAVVVIDVDVTTLLEL
jgi:hypothetical protein